MSILHCAMCNILQQVNTEYLIIMGGSQEFFEIESLDARKAKKKYLVKKKGKK